MHGVKLRFAEFEDSVTRTYQYTYPISDVEMLSYLFLHFPVSEVMISKLLRIDLYNQSFD